MLAKIYLRYLFASIFGLLFCQLAPLVDSLAVSHKVGAHGLAAVGLAMPVFYLLNILCCLIGIGCGISVARFGGEGEKEQAARVFSMGVLVLAAASLLVCFAILAFTPAIALFLGYTPDTSEHLIAFLEVLGWGALPYLFSFSCFFFLLHDNAQYLAMAGMITGSIVNMVADYFFVFHAGYGVAGAAWGNVVGQFASLLVYSLHAFNRNRLMRFTSSAWNWALLRQALWQGMPDAAKYFMNFLQLWGINLLLLRYAGHNGVVDGSILNNLLLVMTLLVAGIAQPISPITATFFGEGNDRALVSMQKTALVSTIVLILPISIFLFSFPEYFLMLFGFLEPLVFQNSAADIKILMPCFVISSAVFIAVNTCTSSGRTLISLQAVCLRAALLLFCAWAGGGLLGEPGIWAAYTVAELGVLAWLIAGKQQFRFLFGAQRTGEPQWEDEGILSQERLADWEETIRVYPEATVQMLDEFLKPARELATRAKRCRGWLYLLTGEGERRFILRLDRALPAYDENETVSVVSDQSLGVYRRILTLRGSVG